MWALLKAGPLRTYCTASKRPVECDLVLDPILYSFILARRAAPQLCVVVHVPGRYVSEYGRLEPTPSRNPRLLTTGSHSRVVVLFCLVAGAGTSCTAHSLPHHLRDREKGPTHGALLVFDCDARQVIGRV